jgi:hypothetical protein
MINKVSVGEKCESLVLGRRGMKRGEGKEMGGSL